MYVHIYIYIYTHTYIYIYIFAHMYIPLGGGARKAAGGTLTQSRRPSA